MYTSVLKTEHFEAPLDGVVERVVTGKPQGRVKVLGVSWRALILSPWHDEILLPGTPVVVLGRRGNTLLVQHSDRTPQKS